MASHPSSQTRLQIERQARALSQTRLGSLANTHPGVISRIESRLVIPSRPQRRRLAEALGILEDELFADFPDRIPLVEIPE